MKITIGDYLIKRLKEVGITHIIGVPGDFNLQFLEQVQKAEDIEFVGSSNELNAAYAADGYARSRGIAALCVTYGVGDLGAIGGVAGSAAEHIPVIVISGAPPLYVTQHRYDVHHSLADGDYANMAKTYEQFSAAQTLVTQENAQEEIDRVIRIALRTSKPVQLQLPSNLSYLEIDVEDTALMPVSHSSDAQELEKATTAILEAFDQAEKPAVLIDMNVDRFNIKEEIQTFIDKTQTPFAAMSTGKGILEESQPLFKGKYAGDASDEGVQELIEGADFVLTVAPRFIEWNSGTYTAALPEQITACLQRNHTFVGECAYEGVAVRDVIARVVEKVASVPEKEAVKKEEDLSFTVEPDKELEQDTFWKQIQPFLEEGDLIFADTGTSNHGMGTLQLPKDAKLVSSHIWGAIGHMLPALFGSLLADPDRRQLLFIGDGAFQVTGQALSRILYRQMNPIIFVINNDGYTIERYIMGMEADYNDIPAWQYHRLPEVWVKDTQMQTFEVSTQGALQEALTQAKEATHGALIEVHMHPMDAPQPLKEFGPQVADFNYGERGPENEDPVF